MRKLLCLLPIAAVLSGCPVDPCDIDEQTWIGDIFIKEPADMDALDGIVCVKGSLLIGEIGHDPAKTGSGLQELELGYSLTSLDGAEDVEIVEGDLHIAGNVNLVNLDGLGNVMAAGRELRIGDNPRGDLIIHQNLNLPNLDGLDALALVGANAIVSANDNLTSVDGMDALETVGWQVRIIDNPRLDTADAQSYVTREELKAAGGVEVSGNGGAGGGS